MKLRGYNDGDKFAMNILFIYTNINGSHSDLFNHGLASIVSMTRQEGHNVKVIIISKEDDTSFLFKEISSFRPRVIGFSSVSSQFAFVKRLSSLLKEQHSETIIVCGGVHPTINPDALLETNSIDGFFIGESEFAFIEFIEKIEKNEQYKDNDNFAYIQNGEVIQNKCKPLIGNLDILPAPDKDTYPYCSAIKAVGYAPFFFSRGCPFLCTYCSNHALAKVYGKKTNPTRFRSPESCIQEIEDARRKFDFKTVFILDDIFGLDRKWREEFCKKYKERIDTKFSCCLRVEFASEEYIKMLREAGCYRILFGVESGNKYIRNQVMNRRMSGEQIIKAFNLCHKFGLETLSLNMIGIPGETKEMVWDTIKLNRRLKPTSSGVNIFYPYKGTVLGDYCFKNQMVNDKLYNEFTNERRDSVLNFPTRYKRMLRFYQRIWPILVYPYNLKSYKLVLYRFIVEHKRAYNLLRRIKRE